MSCHYEGSQSWGNEANIWTHRLAAAGDSQRSWGFCLGSLESCCYVYLHHAHVTPLGVEPVYSQGNPGSGIQREFWSLQLGGTLSTPCWLWGPQRAVRGQ